MGLDNGIIIKNADVFQDELSVCPNFYWDDIGGSEQHIAYWRKCYGIRSAILSVLRAPEEGGEYPLSQGDIVAILSVLKPFLKKKKWENEAESIWTYDDIKESMKAMYESLTWLAEYMKINQELEVYFYDSY